MVPCNVCITLGSNRSLRGRHRKDALFALACRRSFTGSFRYHLLENNSAIKEMDNIYVKETFNHYAAVE